MERQLPSQDWADLLNRGDIMELKISRLMILLLFNGVYVSSY